MPFRFCFASNGGFEKAEGRELRDARPRHEFLLSELDAPDASGYN